jgi:hypothetical protein
MNRTAKVFLSCFIGAYIGGVIARSINPHLWWLGAIVGFGVGYLAYEFEKVIAAAPVAWERTINRNWNWHPDRGWWRAYFKRVISIGNMMANITVAIFGIALWQVRGDAVFRQGGFSVMAIYFVMGYVTSLAIALDSGNGIPNAVNPVRFYCWSTPKFIIFTILPAIPEIFGALLALAGTILGAIKTFLVALYRLTHSELRLLCGLDAAIGVAVGHYFGNVIAGAIIGGFWGVLNFELVSIRWLKLAPVSQSLFRR